MIEFEQITHIVFDFISGRLQFRTHQRPVFAII